jgi:hypothetical protein
MAKRPKKPQCSRTKPQEFVVVASTEDLEQAREYEALLKNNHIPACVKKLDESRQATSKGIVVMVPEEFLDEAYVIIESQDAYDDFYDFALQNESDRDFDSDLFEDDF